MNKNYIRALKNLEPSAKALEIREYKVLCYRFGIDEIEMHTLEETGKLFGLTRERIRQIQAKALEKLRHPELSATPPGLR